MAGAHLAASGSSVGVGLEPGVSYFFGERRFELGASVQFMWLDEVYLLSHGDSEDGDFLILPRCSASVGLDADGFWRVHVSAGYGVAQLRRRQDAPPWSLEEQTVWSHGLGAGFSAGIFHLEIQYLGYRQHADEATVIDLGESNTAPSVTRERRSGGGVLFSVGLVFPIALSGSD